MVMQSPIKTSISCMTKVRVAVLISGNGSNLQALIDATQTENYPAEIVLVISNKADAYGLTRAKQAGIPSQVVSHKDYDSREAFDGALHKALVNANIDVVCLAGFMRLLTPGFVEKWEQKMLNIHPSLLPAFKGAHAIKDALEAGAEETGCTVHYVTAEMDSGPIIEQAATPIKQGDTEESLAERIHALEHKIYPSALAEVAQQFLSAKTS